MVNVQSVRVCCLSTYIKFKKMDIILDFCVDRFLAFKTFLDGRYDNKVPEENRWQLPMLLGYLNRYKVFSRFVV